MINALLSIAYLVFAFLIIKNKGLKRLFYFLLGVVFIPANMRLIPISFFIGFLLYTSSFILSLWYHKEFKIEYFSRCPLFKNLLFIFISCMIIGLLNEYKSPIGGIWEALKYILRTFFLFYVGWFSINKSDERIGNRFAKINGNDSLFYTIIPLTLIVTLYGFATFFTRSNPVLDAVGLEDRFLFEGDESYRGFRVTATNISSSVYGLFCGIFFMCGTFFCKHKKKIHIVALSLLIINLFLTGTRAAIIPFFICISLYLIKYKGISYTIKYSLIGVTSVLILIPILPSSITDLVFEILESIVNAVIPTEAGDEKFGGSSVNLREMQIVAAMEFLKEKPFFGHGIGYTYNVLMKAGKHESLFGMESYICWIGVEFGLVYAITIILFFINCIKYFLKNRIYAPQYAYMGVSLVIMYVVFLCVAWVGDAWYFIMPVLGYITRRIYINKHTVALGL